MSATSHSYLLHLTHLKRRTLEIIHLDKSQSTMQFSEQSWAGQHRSLKSYSICTASHVVHREDISIPYHTAPEYTVCMCAGVASLLINTSQSSYFLINAV